MTGAVVVHVVMKNMILIASLAYTACASAQENPQFQDPVRIQVNGKAIAVPGGYTFPTICDIDNDGLDDLVVGKYRTRGMDFYKNIGRKGTPKYAPAKSLMVDGKPLVVEGVGP